MQDVLAALCILTVLTGLFTAAVRVHVRIRETEEKILQQIEADNRRALKETGCDACGTEADP